MYIYVEDKLGLPFTKIVLYLKRLDKTTYNLPITYLTIQFIIPTVIKKLFTKRNSITKYLGKNTLWIHSYNSDYCRDLSTHEFSCYRFKSKFSGYYKIGFKLFSFGLYLDYWLDK